MNGSRFTAAAIIGGAIVLQLSTSGCAYKPAAGAGSTGVATPANPPKKDCRPVYPAQALLTHAQGTSVIKFTIDATGTVKSADIVKSAGPTPEHRLLDEAAAAALMTCPFKAGVDKAGNPVGATVEVSYRWMIDNPAPAASAASAVTPR